MAINQEREIFPFSGNRTQVLCMKCQSLNDYTNAAVAWIISTKMSAWSDADNSEEIKLNFFIIPGGGGGGNGIKERISNVIIYGSWTSLAYRSWKQLSNAMNESKERCDYFLIKSNNQLRVSLKNDTYSMCPKDMYFHSGRVNLLPSFYFSVLN